MKKSILIISVIILLLLPFVLAVEFEVKDQFNQGETIIAKVSGTFISPLIKNNVLFYKEHTRIPLEYDVNGANGEYYIYALLADKSAGNYSISIENAQYKKGDEIINEKIVKNFSITNNMADFSVNPGFVFPSGDFSLSIENLKDTQISVNVNTNMNDSAERKLFILPEISDGISIPLVSWQEKQIIFKANPGQAALKKIILQTNNTYYEIPVSLPALEGNQESIFSLEPSKFIYSFPTNSPVKKTVYIYNTGNSEMKDISIYLSDSLKSVANTSLTNIEKLGAGVNMPIELTFSSVTETEVEGTLKAKTGETIAYSSIALKFINNYVAPLNQTEQPSGQFSEKTCAELQGIQCNKEGYKCSKDMTKAKDGWCCKGTCDATATSSAGKVIAIIIVIILIVGVVWFYFKKYKKAKKPVNLLEVAKGKDEIK
ncbi:MAG: hypothetical protein AABW47_04185 [Nanoarchaeota archaeon]